MTKSELRIHLNYIKTMNALALYKEKGEDAVKSMYPKYLGFILANKDKTKEEIIELIHKKQMMYKYSIEMFKEKQWTEEIRFYHIEKDLNDFDLCDIAGLRKNATFLGLVK